MTTYQPPDIDTLGLLAEALRIYHPRLLEPAVNVGVLMAHAATDPEGNPEGHALKHHGVPALAKVRIVSLRDRAHGMPDVQMLIDGDRWTLLSREERIALLDHELTHITTCSKAMEPVLDDLGRPKIKMRPHDLEAGWFHEVAERHGKDSQEVQQATALFNERGQSYFAFLNVEVTA